MGTSTEKRPRPGSRRGERGTALIEFAFVLPLLLILAFVVIDFGRLIQTRLVVTNLSREGGSLACRQTTLDPTLIGLLQSSGNPPINLSGADGHIFINRIKAGTGVAPSNVPTITETISGGSLPWGSKIGAGLPRLGLSQTLYNHLLFRVQTTTPPQSAPDISEITVVEVYYLYKPITPLPNFLLRDVLKRDVGNTGMVVSSRAVF